MSSYRILSQVSRKLRSLLWAEFSADPSIRQIVQDAERIVWTNPKDASSNSASKLALWLYNVEENEFVKNRSLRRVSEGGGNVSMAIPPLTLDLSFLVAPITGDPEADLHLLGKTMQVFYENSIVTLRDDEEGDSEELKIILMRNNIETLMRIWETLSEPYRLSVCYCVRPTRISAERNITAAVITDSSRGYGDKANLEEGL